MKILILENDWILYDHHPFTYWVKSMEEKGHEIKIVYNAHQKAEEIIKEINWCDRLAFTTTFIYIYPIFSLTQAIATHRKNPLDILIMSGEISYNLGRMMEMYSSVCKYDEKGEYWIQDKEKQEDFAYLLRHLTIYELDFLFEEKEVLKRITFLDSFIERKQKKIDEDKAYLESRKLPSALTGRMVKIKEFGYLPGPEWKDLKPGMIVPEIDMSLSSNRIQTWKDRGVWVMGKTEPVKLLNDHPYDEFELICTNIDDLAEEIVKKTGQKLTTKNIILVLGCLGLETSSHVQATNICDVLGVERRGYRVAIEKRIDDFNTAKNTVWKHGTT